MRGRRGKKVTRDGITFDSKFEAYVYQLLTVQCSASIARTSILAHFPVDYFGSESPPTKLCTRPIWNVDFLVKLEATAPDGTKIMRPCFAVEAKGLFQPTDPYKFLLWDMYQRIPLIVVYQNKVPGTLQTEGLIEFVHWRTFKDSPIGPTLTKRRKANELRRKSFLQKRSMTPLNNNQASRIQGTCKDK